LAESCKLASATRQNILHVYTLVDTDRHTHAGALWPTLRMRNVLNN